MYISLSRSFIVIALMFVLCGLSFGQAIERFTFSDIFKKVRNSVVMLKVEGTVLVNGQPKTVEGSGSGVVLDNEGYIVTNKHVVEESSVVNGVTIERRSSKVFIVMPSGVEIRTELIGVAPDTDLALIKAIQMPEGLEPMMLDDSNNIVVGEHVVAVGSPFGLGETVTTGIVSAIRIINFGSNRPFPHPMIQTDAAINPGNSGGALVNLEAKLVGIPTLILSQSGTNAGVGFAIPVNIVKKIVEDIKNKKTSVGFLGISCQDILSLSPAIRKQLGIQEQKGVMATGVIPGGPAENASIRQGDIILGINGGLVEDLNSFKWLERNLEPGQEAVLKIKRKASGSIEEIRIKAGSGNNKADQE
ncbi:MAG: trypsin-like peptidase domain-containing protein [bacterium]|nr:trypsin-like peptidase domain-containing protein [bacterium]